MQNMQNIKDKNGKIMGTVRNVGHETIATDSRGKIVGIYNETSNLTKDGNGKIVSTSNTVVGLIK
jgi:hypothetical protein